ncbi:hypothetical protein RclHR1_15540001 [Rhizophagus clarus]|uniref:Uncharacterized protein n=1 Tax=Rhizophagus clarus TaxID=94130 RepID=A0A2Z6QJL5_9GLOM|nr:hypothetical protein RclHR1_15540001 [Rhizophagus clarus]GES95232.1 hypothetical protein GLOIN_2v1815334 [Rhizophagus clarus]
MTAISNTAFDIQVNSFVCVNIPYIKYFKLCSYENWSLHYYVSMLIKNYKFAEKKEAHRSFYKVLHNIKNDLSISQDVRDIAQNLIKNSKADIKNVNSLWEKAIKEKKILPPPVPVLPSSFTG